MARRRGFILGAAIGATIAGGLALLFAPKAGDELRQDIANKAKEVSGELDSRIKQAKIDASVLSGEAKIARLEIISRAEALRFGLGAKSAQFNKSGKKITRVTAREADKMIQDGQVLITELGKNKADAIKETKRFAKKASKSGSKIMQVASSEVKKDLSSKGSKQ